MPSCRSVSMTLDDRNADCFKLAIAMFVFRELDMRLVFTR